MLRDNTVSVLTWSAGGGSGAGGIKDKTETVEPFIEHALWGVWFFVQGGTV